MLRASLSLIGLSCASGFGALLMKGMLSSGMLLAGSLEERVVGVLVLFKVLMVVGFGRRSERNVRLSPHMRSLLWGMVGGYVS